ncbi:hypothetical protein GCM10011331_14630 [Flavimobilis marinus]|uniref:Anti-anti-sigma factor n=1 Tax=Flavimobilis marinus TaxID=285351 RepID=A0A1I2FUA7_9MICO|nr:STAS domain-containing protein [Flavimobilis marinus]GHG51241.1 hypothetical protein GCM10011331_14630 [Flavimobilis marinus]SFF08347.1 anti-anti-sigma factor [Flavimobilis marinus]
MSNSKTGGIELEEEPRATVVRLWGEIDVALRDEASAAMASALQRNLPVVIDTRDVSFIDSTGIAFLVQFYNIGSAEGLAVSLPDAPERVTSVLELLGLAEFFGLNAQAPSAPGGCKDGEPALAG